MIARLLHLGPGEWRKVGALWAVGVAYAAATTLGENVAQSIFAGRVGAGQLARMFLVKGAFDVLASALYLPLTRGRDPARVLRVALVAYAATIVAGRLAVLGSGALPAYALYIGHECAWTVLTIHWGVYVLDVFDAAEARRLFPLIFTAARVGGIAGGAALRALAAPVGAANLLWAGAGLAILGAVLARGGTHPPAPADADEPEADRLRAAPLDRLRATLRASWSSPLVRAIALSTATMVFLRYGLRILSLGSIQIHFAGDEDRVAAFLGAYISWANAAAIALGLLVTPRLLARAGVGAANVAYAAATTVAYGVLLLFPSLGAAVTARFVDTELKDALKTPLSALFYGAERPDRRAEARAFVFGAVIPAATTLTFVAYELGPRALGLRGLVWLGFAAALLFVGLSVQQNRAWRRRLRALLAWKLERAPTPPAAALPPELAPHAGDEAVALAWRGLASDDARTRAVAQEVLAEAIPRALARRVASR